MKNISTYISERLKISTSKKGYLFAPNSKHELKETISKRFYDEGCNCDLNDIDVSNITDMSLLFYGSGLYDMTQFIESPDMSEWDTSNVNNMFRMFYGCKKFNSDISSWDVSSCITMEGMFEECSVFNCDISKWDVSKVENMRHMFTQCHKFNQDISEWDVSKVEDTVGMFLLCKEFNQDLSDWNISILSKNYMENMFTRCDSLKKIPTWYKG